MISLYVLPRLIWRPSSLIILFPLFLGFAWPFLFEAEPRVTTDILWREVAMLSLMGFVAATFARDLKRGFFAWSLPGVDIHLFGGMALLGVFSSGVLATLVASGFGIARGICALGAGLLFFAVGNDLHDPVRSTNYRRTLFGLVIIVLWRPDFLDALASYSPGLFAILTAGAAYGLLRHSFSTTLSRARPFAFDLALGIGGGEGLREYWATFKGSSRQWTTPLSNGGLVEWTRAAFFESYSPRSGGWLRLIFVQVAFGSLMAFGMNNPTFVSIVAGSAFVFGVRQLRMSRPYPISRRQRAEITYLASLVESVTACTLYAGMIWGLYSFAPESWQVLASDRQQRFSPEGAASFASLAFLFAPIAQWTRVYGTIREVTSGLNHTRGWGKPLAGQTVYMVATFAVSIPMLRSGAILMTTMPVILLGALAAQTLYWFALHRHFARANLVGESAG